MSKSILLRTGPWWPNNIPAEFASLGINKVDSPAEIGRYAANLCYAGGTPLILKPLNNYPYSLNSYNAEIIFSYITSKSFNESGSAISTIIDENSDMQHLWLILSNSLDIFGERNNIYLSLIHI